MKGLSGQRAGRIVVQILSLSVTCGAFVLKPCYKQGVLSLQERNSRSPYSRIQRRGAFGPIRLSNEKEPVSFPFKLLDENSGTAVDDRSRGRVSMILSTAQEALEPASKVLDDATGGWALSCADLSPETEESTVGRAFLATNLGYSLVGLLLTIQGDTLLGLLTEICSIASFVYHYTQLQGERAEDGAVRLALFVDYVFAFTSIFVALGYIVIDKQLPPMDGLLSAGIGLSCLFACWVWEEGLPYIVLHSLWHLFSAYAGYSVGSSHLS